MAVVAVAYYTCARLSEVVYQVLYFWEIQWTFATQTPTHLFTSLHFPISPISICTISSDNSGRQLFPTPKFFVLLLLLLLLLLRTTTSCCCSYVAVSISTEYQSIWGFTLSLFLSQRGSWANINYHRRPFLAPQWHRHWIFVRASSLWHFSRAEIALKLSTFLLKSNNKNQI